MRAGLGFIHQVCGLVMATAAGMAAIAAAGMAAAGESGAVLGAAIMAGIAGMAVRIDGRAGMKAIERLLAARRQRAMIAVMWIPAVVDVAVEASRAVEPGSSPDEDTTDEPVRSIVAIGRTVIRGIAEVSVRANGCGPDLDGNLSGRDRRAAQQRYGESRESKQLQERFHFL